MLLGGRIRRRTPAQRVAAEIHRLVDRLEGDRTHALGTWNLWRSKEPLLDALATSWPERSADDLLALDATQLLAADLFFREHARFALWVAHTDAMPATMEQRYDAALALLGTVAAAAIEALGGVLEEDRPVIPDGWASLRR